MSVADITALDIAGLANAIEGKQLSPVEVCEAYLARIQALNPSYKAYISVYPELALEAARAAETEIQAGTYRGPLHGVPLALKDLFQVAGMKRTCGSKIIREDPAESDSTGAARMREAGAVLLGLLNLHEFAFGATGINRNFDGPARNPWNPDRVCGGSSAGSGCATAARLAAATLGTDTGGSIRIPASLCGVVGLKQTYGLASRHGIYPLCRGFDHGGPLARTVRDSALVLQAIAGADPRDPTTRDAQVKDYTALIGQDIGNLKIGVPRRFFFEKLHPEIASAVETAIAQLTALGAAVREIDLPFDARTASAAWNTMALAEAYHLHANDIRDHHDELSPDMRERMLLGKPTTAGELIEAQWVRMRTQRAMAEVLREVDLLVTPTSPIPAVTIADGVLAHDGHVYDGAKLLGRMTRIPPFTGQPAISVPCGFTADGMPIGLQLIGDWYAEPVLLQAAHAYEQAAGWYKQAAPCPEVQHAGV